MLITTQTPKRVGDQHRTMGRRWVGRVRVDVVPASDDASVSKQAVRVFRYDAALAHGITRARVRGAVDAGRVVRLDRGVYATGDDRRHMIAAAVLRLGGEAVVSHATAAELWGIPVLGRPTATVHLTRPRRRTGTVHLPGVHVHHAAVPGTHRTVHHGIAVTTPARTVLDLARAGVFRAGVVAADGALRLRRCTAEELRAVAAGCAGWPGIRTARQVAGFADPQAANPLESISRAAFHEWGLPRPQLQVQVRSLDIVDFLWAGYGVVGEADGMGKYDQPEALRLEKLRQERLERDGFTVVRWTWDEAYHRPDALAFRAGGVLARRGWRSPPAWTEW